MKNTGKKIWAIPAMNIPFETTGEEPEFTSHEKISVLNISTEEAELEIQIFFEDDEPLGPFKLKIKPNRVRTIRFNYLIDPQALELEKNFGCLINSNVPVVIQHGKMDTGRKENAQISTIAFPVKK